MRLIDADALKEHYNVPDAEGVFSYCDTIMQAIDSQPTIEAEPVRHGYWYIERKSAMSYGCTKCSNCHTAVALRGQAIAPNEYYCKNCGSKNSDEDGQLVFGEVSECQN